MRKNIQQACKISLIRVGLDSSCVNIKRIAQIMCLYKLFVTMELKANFSLFPSSKLSSDCLIYILAHNPFVFVKVVM